MHRKIKLLYPIKLHIFSIKKKYKNLKKKIIPKVGNDTYEKKSSEIKNLILKKGLSVYTYLAQFLFVGIFLNRTHVRTC